MTPTEMALIVAGISLIASAVNIYVALYVKAALLSLKADVLAQVRAETYSREVIDLMMRGAPHV